MRVYFHLMDGSEAIPDREGIEVPSLDDAKTEALKAIREMGREQNTGKRDWAGWRLVASNSEGTQLFTLDLGTFH